MASAVSQMERFVAKRSEQCPSGYWRRWVFDRRRHPRESHGELKIFNQLQRRGLTPWYEPWLFALETCHPFQPDIWTEADNRFYEITFLDKAIAQLDETISCIPGHGAGSVAKRAALATRRDGLQERWDRKQCKVKEVRRIHGIQILLIPHSTWAQIGTDDQFDALIAA